MREKDGLEFPDGEVSGQPGRVLRTPEQCRGFVRLLHTARHTCAGTSSVHVVTLAQTNSFPDRQTDWCTPECESAPRLEGRGRPSSPAAYCNEQYPVVFHLPYAHEQDSIVWIARILFFMNVLNSNSTRPKAPKEGLGAHSGGLNRVVIKACPRAKAWPQCGSVSSGGPLSTSDGACLRRHHLKASYACLSSHRR